MVLFIIDGLLIEVALVSCCNVQCVSNQSIRSYLGLTSSVLYF